MPTPKEADDVLLDLPPSDGGTDDEDEGGAFDPATDDEDDEESIGLDVSVGFDQEADIGDLISDLGHEGLGQEGLGQEGLRWTGDNDVTSDQILVDARDLHDGEEDGWTTDNEAAGDSVAHHDDELGDGDLPTLGADSGDGGFDDDAANGTDDDAAELPPIDAGEGDLETSEAGWQEASLLGRLDESVEHENDRVEVAPGVFWPFFPAAQIQTIDLGEVPSGSGLLQTKSGTWRWADGELVNLESGARVSLPKGVSQTAADPVGSSIYVSSDSGLWNLVPGGAQIDLGGPSADPAMITHATIAFSSEGTQSRLWAQSRLGALFALFAEPTRWSLQDGPRPGRHLASDGRRTLAYVHSATNRPCALVQSLDAGRSWTTRTLPISDVSMVQRLLVCRDVVVIVSDSMTVPVLVGVGDQEPSALMEGLRAPVALSYEDSEVVLYGCVVTTERVLLIRQPLGKPQRRPSIVTSVSVAETGMPTAIAAAYDDGKSDVVVLAGATLRRLRLVIERDAGE